MAKKIIRHEFVEIVIPAASTLQRFQFPDIPNLRDAHIWGLQIYDKDQLTNSPISQNLVITKAKVQKTAFITLVNYSGKEFGKQMPAVIFNTLQDDAAASANHHEMDFKAFVGQKVNWPKSYVDFTAAPAEAGAASSFVVSVYYSLPIAQEQRESGMSFSKRG